MSMPTVRGARALPWLIAGIAGVLLAALVLVYFAFLLPDKSNAADVGDLTSTERSAVDTAATRAVNLVSYRRAHFAADWARAVNGTTSTLRSEVDKAASKSSLQKGLDAAKSDTGATVTHASLEGPTGKGAKGYVVLVSLNEYHTTNKAQSAPSNLEVTVVRAKGTWLASDVQQLGLGSS